MICFVPQEDEAEKKFKAAHPDFHDDEDLNETTPILPKVPSSKHDRLTCS